MPAKSLWQTITGNQILRFVFSAGAGFLVDVTLFNLFYYFVFRQKVYNIWSFRASNYALSFSISYACGVIVNFLMTRFLVFSASKLPSLQQFLRFITVAFIGFFANLLILKGMVIYLHLPPPIARPAAALSLFFASFFIHKVFSFNLSLRHHARNHN